MMLKLKHKYSTLNKYEVGVDEAGRGSLAGPVFAACVVLPDNFDVLEINDSKLLTPNKRKLMKEYIIQNALFYSFSYVSNEIIDKINILKATIKAMHIALEKLSIFPDLILVDGNNFVPYKNLKYKCIIKGDRKYVSIAAASIIAKTFRDEYMNELHKLYPMYNWAKNKGYPTKEHIKAIKKYGLSPYHRKTFSLKYLQQTLF